MQSVKFFYFKLYANRDATGSQIVRVVSRKCDDKYVGLADSIFEFQYSMGIGWKVTGCVVTAQYAIQWLNSMAIQTDKYIGSETT